MRKAKPASARDTIARFIEDWRRERPDIDPRPLGILGRAQRLSARLIRASEELLEPMQLTWEAFSLIVSLRRAGKPYAMRPTDIYRQSLITSGAVTNRVDRVVELGLARRVPDTADRRGIVVQLTAAGKALADRAIAMQFTMLAKQLSVLTYSEQAQLTALLGKLLFSLETADATSGPAAEGATKRTQQRAMPNSASRPISPRRLRPAASDANPQVAGSVSKGGLK